MTSLPDVGSLEQEVQPLLNQIRSLDELEQFRVAWLGRKGRLTLLLKELGALSIDQKRVYGPQYNQLKGRLEETLTSKEKELGAAERAQELEKDTLDTTLPGTPLAVGHQHPLSQVLESLVSIFHTLGFVCADGPEIESEFHNFEALNVPADHPARDMQDTFYLKGGQRQLSLPAVGDAQARMEPTLLRTHTSPVQVRILQRYAPPIAIVVPGKVYRHEAMDASHLAVFHQLEGLLVDEKVSFSDLKGTLSRFAQLFFGAGTRTRFRPSFFPFTEPSAEMDVTCVLCSGGGCSVCKQTGWLEVMGAGMVNPNVFRAVSVDPTKYTGFAFGMGIERLAMIKFGVNDLRLFYENDTRFLEQF